MSATESKAAAGTGLRHDGASHLAEASRLLADTLDYEATLATVAALALPQLGSWGIVDVVEEDGSMRRLAVVHPDPARQALARRLAVGWPPEVDAPLGVPVAVRTRRSQIIPRITDEILEAAAQDPENRKLLRTLGMGSVVVAPMLARGHVHGAITFVSPHDHHFDEADREFAEELARRAAMAIDNARLYRAAARAGAAAEEASHAKSEFLAAMSHEMRTPLNAVLGYADLLELELPGPLTDEQRTQVGRIRGSATHLLALVDQVLDLARLESGQLSVGRERASAQFALDEALARVRPAAEAKGVALRDGCAGAAPRWYLGDATRVGQVLDHLLSNAVKFTAAGGSVRVACGVSARAERVSGPGPWLCVEIEDTGVGIAPDRVDQMFEPFRQGQEGHTRSEGGAGLGLTLARHLARLMRGEVTVRSTPGVGSCFTLWLPAAPDQEVDADRDERTRRRSGEAIAAASHELICRLEELLQVYVRRIRADMKVPHAHEATDVDLLNHAGTLLTDVAQSMTVLGGSTSDAPRLLRDGSRIQRLVAELHAEQRRRLGWAEPEVRRDFELLREEVEACIRAHLPGGEGADAACAVAARLLRQSERIAVQAHRAAGTHAE
ncbi:MAG TPA: ATP-binding protein [Longimicrobium sp.]|nr:ATP-binding protein [Longimicrobium sp.]